MQEHIKYLTLNETIRKLSLSASPYASHSLNQSQIDGRAVAKSKPVSKDRKTPASENKYNDSIKTITQCFN